MKKKIVYEFVSTALGTAPIENYRDIFPSLFSLLGSDSQQLSLDSFIDFSSMRVMKKAGIVPGLPRRRKPLPSVLVHLSTGRDRSIAH